jgi:hypothetical protein
MDGRSRREAGPVLGRRDMLRGAMALPLTQALGGHGAALGADDADTLPSGMISRQKNPENLEFPFSTLDTRRTRTPNERFYVRTHFEVPEIGAKS